MAQSVAIIAEIVLAEARARGQTVDPLKLQKLLYYAQGHHRATTGKNLFDEKIEAWEKGPAIRAVYRLFKSWGFKPIRRTTTSGWSKVSATQIASVLFTTMLYGGLGSVKLSKMTHGDDLYVNAWNIGVNTPNEGKIEISGPAIEKFFKTHEITTTPMLALAQCRRSASNYLVSQGVILENSEEVAGYLVKHSKLESVVNRTIKRVRHDRPDAEIVITMFHSMDSDDHYLQVLVREKSYATDLMANLEKIWEADVAPNLASLELMSLNTDFGSPQG